MSRDKIGPFVWLTIILLLLSAIFFYVYSENILEYTKENSILHLNELSDQISGSIKTTMKEKIVFIKGVATTLTDYDDLFSPKSLNRLEDIALATDFSEMWIGKPDGTAARLNQEIINVKEKDFFKSAMNKQSGVSDSQISTHNDGICFYFYTPIIRENNVVGTLYASYDVTAFDEILSSECFDGKGYSYIFKSNGDLICSSTHASSEVLNLNILEYMQNNADQKIIDTFSQDILRGESGQITYNVEGKAQTACYTPIGINGLYVMTVMPNAYYLDNRAAIEKITYVFCAEIVGVLLITVVLFIYNERSSNKKIVNAYGELNFISNNIPGGLLKCTVDKKHSFIYISNGFLNQIGYTREEIRWIFDNSFINIIYDQDRKYVISELQNILENDDSKYIEFRMFKKNGEMIHVSNQCRIMIENGCPYIYSVIFDITQQKRTLEALEIRSKQYRIAIAQTNNIMFDYDIENDIIINEDNKAIALGYEKRLENAVEELLNSGTVHPDFAEAHREAYVKIRSGAESATYEAKIKPNKPGSKYVWSKINMVNIFDGSGSAVKTVGIIQDISRQKEIELKLLEEEKYKATILAETIFVYEYSYIEDLEIELCLCESHSEDFYAPEIYFYKEANLDLIHPDDVLYVAEELELQKIMSAFRKGQKESKLQFRIKDKYGNFNWIETTIHIMPGSEDKQYIIIAYVKNISEQKNREEELKYRAERDSLTGIYNRSTFELKVNEILSNSSEHACHALLILDVDKFKSVNDIYGHFEGDKLLIKLAHVISSQFSEGDVVGRLGGDEFIVFMTNVNSIEEVLAKSKKLCSNINRITVGSEGENLSASIGISLYNRDGTDFGALYIKADKALYEAKDCGRNRYRIYRGDLTTV